MAESLRQSSCRRRTHHRGAAPRSAPSASRGLGHLFSRGHAAMLRKPPFADADRLVLLNITQRTPAEGELRHRWSWARFQLLKRNAQSFEALATSSNNVVTVTGTSYPEPLPVEIVSPGYLTMMRAPMILGTDFNESEAASHSVVIGHDLWQRRFSGNNDVLGSTLQLNGVHLTVPGWRPAASTVSRASPRHGFPPRPRLARDVCGLPQDEPELHHRPRAAATAALTLDGRKAPNCRRSGSASIRNNPAKLDTPRTVLGDVMTLNDARIDVVTRRALMLLTGARPAMLLLIACANVAGLLLGRAAHRRREIAHQAGRRAGTGRLVRQLLVERLVPSLQRRARSALGVTGLGMPSVASPATLARGRNFYGAVGEFATRSSTGACIAFAVRGVRVYGTVVRVFCPRFERRARDRRRLEARGDARSAGSSADRGFATRGSALQVALAVVLLVACGLLLDELRALRETPLGLTRPGCRRSWSGPQRREPTGRAPALIDRLLAESGAPGRRRRRPSTAARRCRCSARTARSAWSDVHGRRPAKPTSASPLCRARPFQNAAGCRSCEGRGHDRQRPTPASRRRRYINEAAARGSGRPERTPSDSASGSKTPSGIRRSELERRDRRHRAQRGVSAARREPNSARILHALRAIHVSRAAWCSSAHVRRATALAPQIGGAVDGPTRSLALFDVQTMEARAACPGRRHSFQTALSR